MKNDVTTNSRELTIYDRVASSRHVSKSSNSRTQRFTKFNDRGNDHRRIKLCMFRIFRKLNEKKVVKSLSTLYLVDISFSTYDDIAV